jgi:uncharacterized protein (DUF2235 family)
MPKRIIILCDGTGQSSARGAHSVHTNVTRFGQALRHDGGVQQLIFYQSGIGTQDLDKWSKTLSSACPECMIFWAQTDLSAGIGGLGYGLEDNVADAYLFLTINYKPGDEIFIFGFSRGAFTARVLANFVARVGVLRKAYSWEMKKAFAAYREGSHAFEQYLSTLASHVAQFDAKDPDGPRTQRTSIKVVGCWDTVASVGVPDYTKYINWSNHYEYLDGSLVKGEISVRDRVHQAPTDHFAQVLRTPSTLWH